MAINNRLLNSCTFIIGETSIVALIINLRKRTTVSVDTLRPQRMTSAEIMAAIADFVKTHGIDRGINIHVISTSSTRHGTIYGDTMQSLQKKIKFQYGITVHIHSIADMLAYKQWNDTGALITTIESKRRWMASSRTVLAYIDDSDVCISMINNNTIIDGIDLDHDMYCVAHAGIQYSNQPIQYRACIDMLADDLHMMFHPDVLYFYFNGCLMCPMSTTSSYITIIPEDFIHDISLATIIMDSSNHNNPDYINQSIKDYNDIYIPIENNGTITEVPIFEH